MKKQLLTFLALLITGIISAQVGLPTDAEWTAEIATWSPGNRDGAWNSPLKIPTMGNRDKTNGTLTQTGDNTRYWSSSRGYIDFHWSVLVLRSPSALIGTGCPVLCIKD